MRRRDFIKGIVGSAVAWPLVARAQQRERIRRVGFLSNKSSGDAQGREEVVAFAEALKTDGWISGGNLQIDYRWGAADGERYRTYAAELVAQAPDVLLAAGGTVTGALQRVTRDIPIVFVETSDPVNRGLVASLSRPGCLNTASAGNGSNCSSRLRLALRVRRSFVIPANSPASLNLLPFRQLRRRLAWT
jgi:putative tryptophan/tyrosine transport system substrate-binding protein